MLKRKYPGIVLLALISIKGFSWGEKGHKMVAAFAKAALSKQVADSVQHFLGSMSFEDAAVWMDVVRSDHSYDYMKPWHYINIEKDATYVSTPDPHVVSQLELALSMLSDKPRKADKTQAALKFLFHLIGDIHQPLHCGYGADKGGNEINVGFGDFNNLHSVWDSGLIEESGIILSDCFKFSNSIPAAEKKQIQVIDVTGWMKESRSLLPFVYNFQKGKLNKDYIKNSKPVIEKQLVRAGIRLATVLNKYFSR